MKKLFLALILFATKSFGQSASLTIRNHNSNCMVYVNMMAIDSASGNIHGCDIGSNVIVIPPSTTTGYSWATPGDFARAGLFSGMTVPVSVLYLDSTSSFAWTDASFQFQCPHPLCQANGGDFFSDSHTSGTMRSCRSSGQMWSGIDCLSGTSTWTCSSTGIFMENVVIDFY